ncbi:thioredoxin [Acetilactobacillus jinshanensis]|uniref:Thioredoxin n=1 Tax=Acetilactobacillus jinshanensis TaxID=1720083 RepID=A0A4P6ZM36_9LACO|nr:thioredoxin [Acetilactobacillus jinshanensis]QBP18906.1 thioredoxin [Acetilactobacillus jinshanensis]URL60545.1 thioredoxin [uncultured bacterium]
MATVITKDNLKSETNNPLTVIDFWAPWCGPCKMMKPIMDQLENEFKGQIHFGSLDVSHQQKLAEKYTVMSIPSLVIFEHGKAHEKVTGYYPKAPLAKFLKQKLAEINK